MKRLLVYDQSPDVALPYGKTLEERYIVQRVSSISEALIKHIFLKAGEDQAGALDFFFIHVKEKTKEITDFLIYVKRHKPKLPLIVLTESAKEVSLLKKTFRNTDIEILEGVYKPDFLNAYLLKMEVRDRK